MYLACDVLAINLVARHGRESAGCVSINLVVGLCVGLWGSTWLRVCASSPTRGLRLPPTGMKPFCGFRDIFLSGWMKLLLESAARHGMLVMIAQQDRKRSPKSSCTPTGPCRNFLFIIECDDMFLTFDEDSITIAQNTPSSRFHLSVDLYFTRDDADLCLPSSTTDPFPLEELGEANGWLLFPVH